jgi:hypothetical protein
LTEEFPSCAVEITPLTIINIINFLLDPYSKAERMSGAKVMESYLWNSLGFHAQIEDSRLKWCIPRENFKNNTTGRSRYKRRMSPKFKLVIQSRLDPNLESFIRHFTLSVPTLCGEGRG